MNTIPDKLFEELESWLNFLQLEICDQLRLPDESVGIIMSTIEKLKAWCAKYSFGSTKEEITFFRDHKPRFTFLLIYYNSI